MCHILFKSHFCWATTGLSEDSKICDNYCYCWLCTLLSFPSIGIDKVIIINDVPTWRHYKFCLAKVYISQKTMRSTHWRLTCLSPPSSTSDLSPSVIHTLHLPSKLFDKNFMHVSMSILQPWMVMDKRIIIDFRSDF